MSAPRAKKGFSPLRKGDTSVAGSSSISKGLQNVFQSPSQGGHLCGQSIPRGSPLPASTVSVPFARGTPLWPAAARTAASQFVCFSPLRKGDTSVAELRLISAAPAYRGFSPLRKGDTSVAQTVKVRQHPVDRFQSPSQGGHLCGRMIGLALAVEKFGFQSPSQGGHLCGRRKLCQCAARLHVSVPFARGTPPLADRAMPTAGGPIKFQSPSRGGHLRWPAP